MSTRDQTVLNEPGTAATGASHCCAGAGVRRPPPPLSRHLPRWKRESRQGRPVTSVPGSFKTGSFKARRVNSSRAFTLLELLIVLALLAVLTGVIAGAVGVLSRRNDTRAALTAALDALTLARIEAMRSARPRTVTVVRAQERLLISTDPGVSRSIRAADVTPVDARLSSAAVVARFDGSGRTDASVWLLAQAAPTRRGTLPEGVRIWRVEFDPISGAPSLIDPAADRATTTKASHP